MHGIDLENHKLLARLLMYSLQGRAGSGPFFLEFSALDTRLGLTERLVLRPMLPLMRR